MPTQTFFNLPDKKRKKLIQIAIKEFTNHSLKNASVSNIVEKAAIPRGSFYQYFENLEDLFFYVLDLFDAKFASLKKEVFKQSNQSFAQGIHTFGQNYIKYVMDSDDTPFLKRIYLSMDPKIRRRFANNIMNLLEEEPEFDMDWSRKQEGHQLKVSTEREFQALVSFIINVLNQDIIEGFSNERAADATQRRFSQHITWIMYGALEQS